MGDILLIAPKYSNYGRYYHFPIGLAYISSSLKKHGFNVHCLNLNHYENEEEAINNILKSNNIKIIATGGLSAHFDKIKILFDRFDEKYIKIVGGGIISSEPQLMYEALNVDYGVLKEGEETIVELADHILNDKKNLFDIQGIVYRDDDKLVLTPPRDSINDLDDLPFPDYDAFEIDKYLDNQLPNDSFNHFPYDKPRMIPILTTRSCPFSCTFCYHPLGKTYRISSLDYFFEWLDYLITKYDVNILMVLDELFSVNKTRMYEFAERIKPYNLKWLAAMRVTDVDDDVLRKLKDSGLYYISYGIESANNDILKSMKKKIKIEDIERALELTRKHKIGIQGNLIFGDINETHETYKDSLLWWEVNQQYQIMLSSIIAYPGTPIYQLSVESEIIENKLKFIQDGCPQLNLTSMSDEDYIKMRQDIIDSIDRNKLYPKIIESKVIGYDKFRGDLYSIELICPHCNQISLYSNMHKEEAYVMKLCCRHCNQKFDVKLTEMFSNHTYEHTYFLNKNKALIIAKEKNVVLHPNSDKNELQFCYYGGEELSDSPSNCIKIEFDIIESFFANNEYLPLPTRIEFGLASFIGSRKNLQTEFYDMINKVNGTRQKKDDLKK